MFRFLKRNDSEVITPEVVDVPVTTIQSNIAMALALCMEEYLRSVSKTSVDIPNRDTLVREYNTLVDAGLGSSKNARLLQAKISEYNQIALDAMRAKNLFSFVKRAREVFGENTLLVGSKQFDDVCKKYKLVKGLLKQYTGVIPDRNIREILEVKRKLNGEGPMFSDLGLEYANGAYYYVTGINYGYSDSETMLNNLKKYIESHNHIVIGPDTEGTLRLSSIINKNPGLPADVKAFSYPNIVSFDSVKIGRNELFVACPPSQLNNPEVTITKKAVDPIVYQPCAYGILIHSMWGEESEDKVFEEYKRINNLML